MPDFVKLTKNWRGDALALLAGALTPLAFAPLSYAWLAPLTLMLLFALWQGIPTRRVFWRGYLFGLGMFAVGVTWVSVSMYRFGGMGVVGSGLMTVLFVVILSLYPALVGLLTRKITPAYAHPVSAAVIFASSWTLLEWIRGWLFTGFPWLNIGYSQMDWPLAGLAPYLGVYGISWAVALTAVLIPALFRKTSWNPALAVLFVVWGLSWLAGQWSWTEVDGKPLKVSLVQGNITQDVKWMPGQERPTYELYTRLTRDHFGSDIVVWPETALPLFYHEAKGMLQGFMAQARSAHTDLILGMPVLDMDSGRYYNGLLSLNGEASFYYKQHLVPFGEYLPLKQTLGSLLDMMAIPMSDFTPGPADQHLLKAAGVKLGASICYEDAFGEETIHALPEAQLLVNVSNDAWFGDSMAPHQHLQMARMRSLETGRWMLRATNNGISALIDDQGRVVERSPQFKVHVLTGKVQPRKGATPYVRFGNGPILVLIVLGLALALLRTRRRKR